MKEHVKAYWGLIFVAALVVPYALGVWDDYGHIYVVGAAVALLVVSHPGASCHPDLLVAGLEKKAHISLKS